MQHQVHKKNILQAGKRTEEADKVLIMLHGRGGSAEDILSLAPHLHVKDYALLAPQAANHTWYPYSFLAPPAENEPWLSSALSLLQEVVSDLEKTFLSTQLFFAGFSQGACLTLEFVTRNAKQYGGVAAFTGGLIGDRISRENYSGSFGGTPVFIGSSDPDPHVPVQRVRETTAVLTGMGANVLEKIYPKMGHTIIPGEMEAANQHVFSGTD